VSGELARDAASDAFGGPSDDRDIALETHVATLSKLRAGEHAQNRQPSKSVSRVTRLGAHLRARTSNRSRTRANDNGASLASFRHTWMPTNTGRLACRPFLVAVATAVAALILPPRLGAQTAPGEIAGHKLPVPGERVEGTTAKLSEVEAAMVAAMGPQGQAERLLQYAISHHLGATDDIKARVKGWRGAIAFTPTLNTLLDVARNGDDLRVRAAAIEIELAALNIVKTTAQVDALLGRIAPNPPGARQEIYMLGLLANRGVDAARIHDELRLLTRSEQDLVRYQAYAAIANIGTDDAVRDLVEAFHHDPSRVVRIDAGGCGLAHCGMLTRAQRMLAIPGLLDLIDDKALDAVDVAYGYRALREITDETLPDDAPAWRQWYAAHGAETTDRFRKFDDSEGPSRHH
jgi:hypothetical protein